MESWLLGTKFAVTVYVVVRWAGGTMSHGGLIVILTLCYISATALSHVVRARAGKLLCLALSVAVPACAAVVLDPRFTFLLPVNSAELVRLLGVDFRFAPAPALVPLFFLPAGLWPEYVLCATFGMFMFFIVMQQERRLRSLQDDNETLRIAGEVQRRRMVARTEYENQLRRLGRLEERSRLAREVHDRVGHTISGSLVQLEAASELLPKDAGRAERLVLQSIDALRDGMESIRSTLRGMKPDTEELGIERLRTVLDQFTASTSIQTHLTHSGDLRMISLRSWSLILDNAREVLTNVMKHAHATSVWATVGVMPKLVKIEIRDNGRGAYTVKKGLGIQGIEERTQEEGGSLIVDGTRGFSVIMLLPNVEAIHGDQGADRG